MIALIAFAAALGFGRYGAATPDRDAPPGAPAEPAPAPAHSQVALKIVRFDRGTGPVLVSGAVPLRPGALRPADGAHVRVLVGGKEQAAYVEPLQGRHRDGSVISVLVQFRYAVPADGVNAVLDIGTRSTVPRIAAPTAARGAPAASAVPLGADYLVGTRIAGPVVTVRDAADISPAIRKYDEDFAAHAERRWQTDVAGLDGKPLWEVANYYDRGMIAYVWWARTGDPKYLARGHALVLDYRKNYVEANRYGLAAHWAFLDGLTLHYLLTGDEASRVAVGRIADDYTRPYYLGQLHSPAAETDNRIQARVLTAFLLAHRIKAPHGPFSTGATAWADYGRQALAAILKSQSTDGAYRMQFKQCGYNKPFMVGILNDALIRYHDEFEADSRIAPAVKRSLDYMWAKNWLPRERAFTYLEGPCGTRARPTEHGGPGGASDLNNLIVNGFAWYARQSGNKTYRDRADQIFESAVTAPYLAGSKQFNQQYSVAHHYIAYRATQ